MDQKTIMKKARELSHYGYLVQELRDELLTILESQLEECGYQSIEHISSSGFGNLKWMRAKMRRGYRSEIKTRYILPAFANLVRVRRFIKKGKNE